MRVSPVIKKFRFSRYFAPNNKTDESSPLKLSQLWLG